MKPLNTKERRSAFISFLIFFAITTGLVVLTVFFGFRVPLKQTERMNQKIVALEKEMSFMQQFYTSMTDIRKNLDTINKPGVYFDAFNADTKEKLASLKIMVDRDTTVSLKNFYYDVSSKLEELRSALEQIRKFNNQNFETNTLQQEIENWRTKYDALQRDYYDCRDQLSRSIRNPG